VAVFREPIIIDDIRPRAAGGDERFCVYSVVSMVSGGCRTVVYERVRTTKRFYRGRKIRRIETAKND